MGVDYHALIGRLLPEPDGETAVAHRTGMVTAVNADGTVDLTLGGASVASVAVLGGASVAVDGAVQVLAWGGDLLVLGAARSSAEAAVDFQNHVDMGNTSLTMSFVNSASLVYTPPTGWEGYKLQAEVSASLSGVTGGDNVEIQADVSSIFGSVVTDNGGPQRHVKAFVRATGLSSAVTLNCRMRNATAVRGVAATSWISVTAARTA